MGERRKEGDKDRRRTRKQDSGDPGGADARNHPFDKEVHPAEESARPAARKGSGDKRGK